MSKKKHIFYILILLALVWAYQYSEIYFMNGENQLIEAFNRSEFEVTESQMSVWGIYNRTYMTKESRIQVVSEIAQLLGLTPNYEFNETEDINFKEIQLIKQARDAKTVIKMVSMEEVVDQDVKEVQNYLMIDLTLYKDINSILYYKEEIEELLSAFDMTLHVSINIIGEKEGEITEANKELLSEQMLEVVHAKKQEAFISEGIYSIYGYTPLIEDYIMSGNKKINVDVAFTYDETSEVTRIYLATPLITVLY